MPLYMRLVSAGSITDSLGREWDPIKHPRGRDGRFIRVAKLIHMFLNSDDSEPWGSGQVVQINANGSIRAKVTAVVDPKHQDRVGHMVDVLPGVVESVNEKASLSKAKEDAGGKSPFDTYDFSKEKMHDFFANAGLGTDAPGDLSYAVKAASDFKAGNSHMPGPRARYHLALYAKSISGGEFGDGPAHTDAEYMDLLEELGVDPAIVDDTPDGMSGLKALADDVNINASPNYAKLDSIEHFDEVPPLAHGTLREARLRSSDVYVRWYADGKQSVVWPDGTEKQHDKNKGSLLLAAHEAHKAEGVSPEQKVTTPEDVLMPPESAATDVTDPVDSLEDALDDVQVETPALGKFEVLDDPGTSGDGYYPATDGSKLWGKYGAAGVMIRHTDENGVERFLMVQRGPIVSSNKGKWQLPGGALNSNENDYQGTARELVEELSPPDGYIDGLTPVGEVKLDHPSGWHYNNIAADSPEQFEPHVDGTETGDAGWFTKEEIAALPLHPAFAANLENIFGKFSDEETNAPDASTEKHPVGEKIDASGWTQVGGQGGSNTGGVFAEKNGDYWYVKNQKSESHAKNEALAAALYEEAGINSAPQILADTKWGPNGTASPWIENTKDFSSKRHDPEYRKKVQEGFAFDAWIANWDTMGLEWDNIVTDKDGNPLRVDPGGALFFRAQGKPKGSFGDEVVELVTFKDQSNNAGKINHDIDPATELASAQKVIDISPERIDELVDAMDFPDDGPFDGEFMKKTLKARRVYIADYYGIPLPENEATPDPIPVDITDADLPEGFTPIESNGPANDYIDKHSIYFFDEDTQNEISELGGYHAENSYGKLVAYFAEVQNGDVEFNSEIVDIALGTIIDSLDGMFDTQSQTNIAKSHVEKLNKMRNDLIPFENKQTETPTPDSPDAVEAHLPVGPGSTDWEKMVDDQGPYRWGYAGQKLRVGDQVVSKNDGATGVIHAFEKNHKGVIVKTPDGKKKARKNDTLALATANANTPSAPPPSRPTGDDEETYDTLHEAIQSNTDELKWHTTEWSDDYGDYVGIVVNNTLHGFESGNITATDAASAITTLYNEFLHKQEIGDDNALGDESVNMLFELANDYYAIDGKDPSVDQDWGVESTADDEPKAIYTGIAPLFDDDLTVFVEKYGDISPNGTSVKDAIHLFVDGYTNGDTDNAELFDKLNKYANNLENSGWDTTANELRSVVKSASPSQDAPDASPTPDINILGESLSDDLINYMEDFGTSIYMEPDVPMTKEIEGYIEELNNGDITPVELGQKLDALAYQIDEPWNPKPGQELHDLAAKFPQPETTANLDTVIDNIVDDLGSGNIYDVQEYDLPDGYKITISEPDENGDGYIDLLDSDGDKLESWNVGWASSATDAFKGDIQDFFSSKEKESNPDPNAPDPWNPPYSNPADPHGHSASSAVIEYLIDDFQTGDIWGGKSVNLPYGLEFNFEYDDVDAHQKFQVVDTADGHVYGEWGATYTINNVDKMRSDVESILNQVKSERDDAAAKKASKGMFSPPDDPNEVLGEDSMLGEWMVGEYNEKLDSIIAKIENSTGDNFNADAGDVYEILIGNKSPNQNPGAAAAAIAVADHLDNTGLLVSGDVEKVYDALGIPSSFYHDKEPHLVVHAILTGKGFGDGDNENTGTLGDIAEVDNELAEWEKELLWEVPTHVNGAHQPDSADATTAFLLGKNPPVGVQLKYDGYNWTLSYVLDDHDEPVYVLRDSDQAIQGAWDQSTVDVWNVDSIASDIWTKMHANDTYEEDTAQPSNAGGVSLGLVPSDADLLTVEVKVSDFMGNQQHSLAADGDWIDLPDGYKLKYEVDQKTGFKYFRLYDGDGDLADEWYWDDGANEIASVIYSEVPSLAGQKKAPPVGNPKIDYNGNTYDTPPSGFKPRLVSTTAQDVVVVEHPDGTIWYYHASGGHEYIYGTLDDLKKYTDAWKPFPGENTESAPGPVDLDELIATMPKNIGAVKKIFPGMNDGQAKQYRNASYALTDVNTDEPFSPQWQSHLDKAKYNLKQAGPLAAPTLDKLEQWELDVKGITVATEPKTLGPGFAKLPPGAVPVYGHVHNGNINTYIVKHTDGSLKSYNDFGDVIASHDSLETYEKSPSWYKVDENGELVGVTILGPGFTPVPDGYTPKYVWMNPNNGVVIAYAVENPNGGFEFYYSDGSVISSTSWASDLDNDPGWQPYGGGAAVEADDETDHGDPAPGDISVATGSTVSKFYGHDYTKQADGTWTSPTNSTVIDPDSPAAKALNDHVKNPGVPVPEGDPGTKGEYRVDANGNVMRVGDMVVSTTDGLTGYISKFENNDKGVMVVGSDGKPRARHRLKLKNTDPNAAPPKAPEVMPSAVDPNSAPPSVAWTPPKSSAEVDPSSPWFEQPKPTAPTPPADMGIQYVSDAWMAEADANYKKRMKAKNANWTEKDLSQSSTYSQFINVRDNGDIHELDRLLSQGRITPQMHADAKAQVQKNEVPVKQAQAQYDADVQKYSQDVLAWNKANGVVWGVFPGAPQPASEPFLGGPADWSKAPLGTPAAQDVVGAMSTADTALAVRGASFSFDSDQVEDLDVRVMRVLDSDGTERLEFKFKMTAWAGDEIKKSLDANPSVTSSHGIALNDRKIDSNTGLPKYLIGTKYSTSGTTWIYTDPGTGARVEVTRDGSSETHVHSTTLHNQVRVFMPAGSSAEDFQKTMEKFGIKQATPATPTDVRAYAENKIMSIFGGDTDPTKNLSTPASRSAKLNDIAAKYGVTAADLRLGVNGKGRTKLFLSDAARDKMIAYANVKGFKHNFASGNDINRWKSVLIGENNGLLSTHARWSEGISGSGMSSSSDMGSGAGGDFIYTRVMHTHDNNAKSGSYVVLHPKAMMRRTDVYSNQSDNGTGKHYDGKKAYDIMQGNPYEVVWKHGIPLDEMYYVVVPSTTMRTELIQYLHSKGITHINGIAVEDFVLTSGMPVPVVDESQWSTADMPPAIGAVPGTTL